MAHNTLTYELLDAKEPKIFIPWETLCDIRDIYNSVKDEVGWIGECERDGWDFTITNVTVPRQKVHSTTTEIKDKDLFEIVQSNEIDMDNWRYWGHSHCNMQVSPSGQDISQMKELCKECKWFVGTIHNYDDEVYGYIVDIETGIFYKNVPVEILYPETRKSITDWNKLCEERVTKKISTPPRHSHSGSYYNSSYNYNRRNYSKNNWYGYGNGWYDELYEDEYIEVIDTLPEKKDEKATDGND